MRFFDLVERDIFLGGGFSFFRWIRWEVTISESFRANLDGEGLACIMPPLSHQIGWENDQP